jgi:hypothetical protein
MKTFKYLFAVALVGSLAVSCYNMDIMPTDSITDEVLLTSDNGIKKYLTISYHDLPIEDFNYYAKSEGPFNGYAVTILDGNNAGGAWQGQKLSLSSFSGEAVGFMDTGGGYQDYEYWTFHGAHNVWNRIRELNYFIEALPTYAGNFTEEQFNGYLGEARFLRAYYYFALARRYGGVPLVTVAQNPAAPAEELMLGRATEYETWKFIQDELQFAMENAPVESESGRMNRYVAAALMSRAMLYAGSIAKYGGYINISNDTGAIAQGLMGMTADKAQEFFKASLDAGKFIEASGLYGLHGLDAADKEQAFVEVFTTSTEEDIFVKSYGLDADGIAFNAILRHSWDALIMPNINMGENGGPGSSMNPAWDLLRLYEMPALFTDDDWTVGTPVRFNSREELWNNGEMEARARATFYFSGMTETGTGVVFDIQKGVYTDYPGTVADGTPEEMQNDYTGEGNTGRRQRGTEPGQKVTVNGVEYQMTGLHGCRDNPEQVTKSGVYIRKYVSNELPRGLNNSKQSWKVFRYGEIVMNMAEAAYELGQTSEAFEYIADIRQRAGATPRGLGGAAPKDALANDEYGYPIDDDLQFIREERARELAFENHAMLDQIRWRIADKKYLNNFVQRTLQPYYIIGENKWIFLPEVEPANRRLTFESRRYYNQIPGSVRQRNTNLIDNAGY